MKNTSIKNRARVYANRVMAGLALITSLLTPGCIGVRYNISRSGCGIVKTADGVARFGTNVSVGDKLGFYSDNPEDANYKDEEIYTGKGFGDRVKNIATAPIGALEQTLDGVGDIFGGIYGATIGQIPEGYHPIKQISNPETKYGPIMTPTIQYSLDNLMKFGCVEKKGLSEENLEKRFKGKGFDSSFVGLLPLLNHFGDESKPVKDRYYDAIGEVLFIIPSLIGGNSGGVGGSSSGIGGGNGAGGVGGN